MLYLTSFSKHLRRITFMLLITYCGINTILYRHISQVIDTCYSISYISSLLNNKLHHESTDDIIRTFHQSGFRINIALYKNQGHKNLCVIAGRALAGVHSLDSAQSTRRLTGHGSRTCHAVTQIVLVFNPHYIVKLTLKKA